MLESLKKKTLLGNLWCIIVLGIVTATLGVLFGSGIVKMLAGPAYFEPLDDHEDILSLQGQYITMDVDTLIDYYAETVRSESGKRDEVSAREYIMPINTPGATIYIGLEVPASKIDDAEAIVDDTARMLDDEDGSYEWDGSYMTVRGTLKRMDDETKQLWENYFIDAGFSYDDIGLEDGCTFLPLVLTDDEIDGSDTFVLGFMGIVMLLVLALLVLEPHMSGILLTTAIVGTILLLGGSGGIITWGCAGAALFLLETLLKHVDSIDYLQSRLDGWTQDLDRMTSQTKQSLYAIGSGGATGLGLGNSIEKQLWLPESTNDFIFSVVCEELGFVGAVIVIVLFVLFLVQGFWIAFHAENRFCTLVGIGIMAQIAWQVFCNIAVVTNTLPNTGISLPFFSSGGTSLILLLAEMGVMVNIGRNGERARLEREEAHAERERQRKAKTIVLDTARRAQTEQ